jgi:predicted DNA-binding transcriptional regulator
MDNTPPEHEDVAVERDVLDLLVSADGARHWSIEEITREIGSELKVRDAVAGLYRAGLAHKTSDGFVFATRAASRASELRM